MKPRAARKAKPKAKAKARKPAAAAAPALDLKRAEFARQYLIDKNGAAAARRAGYSDSSAKVTACRLLAEPAVQDEIARLAAERDRRLEISADRTLQALASIGYARVSDFYDADGRPIPLHLLPAHVVAAVQTVKTTEKDGKVVHELRLEGRKGSLELLGRHQGLFRAGMLPDGSGGEVPMGAPGAPLHVAGELKMVIERRVVHVQQSEETSPAPAARPKR